MYFFWETYHGSYYRKSFTLLAKRMYDLIVSREVFGFFPGILLNILLSKSIILFRNRLGIIRLRTSEDLFWKLLQINALEHSFLIWSLRLYLRVSLEKIK